MAPATICASCAKKLLDASTNSLKASSPSPSLIAAIKAARLSGLVKLCGPKNSRSR